MSDQDRITHSDVLTWRRQREDIFGPMRKNILEDEGYLNWAVNGEVGQAFAHEKYKQFTEDFVFRLVPFARMIVNNGMDLIMLGEIPGINVHIPKSLHRSDDERKAHEDKIRRWLQGWFYKLTTYRTESPLVESAEDCLGLGMTCIYYPLNWAAWPDYPFMVKGKQREPRNDKEREKVRKWEHDRQQAFPWDVRAVHPYNAMPSPYEDPPKDLIILERMRTPSDRPEEATDRPVGQVGGTERITYCSADWYGIWNGTVPFLLEEDGAIDGVAPNPTGTNWFRIAWSGFGKADAYGNFEFRGKGNIRDARPIIDMLTTSLNARDSIRILTAFAQFVFQGKGPNGLQKAIAVRDSFRLGSGLGVATDEFVSIAPLAMPPVPPVVFEEEQSARIMYEMFAGPDLTKRQPGEPAVGYSTRISRTVLRFQRTKHNLEQAWAAVCQDVLQMVRNQLKDGVTTYFGGKSETLKRGDIPDEVEVYLDFAPITEEERAAKIALGKELRARDESGMPAISRRTFQVEHAGIDDPESEDEEIWIEDMLDSPRLKDLASRFLEARLTRRVPEMAEQVDADLAEQGKLPMLEPETVATSQPLPSPNGGGPGAGFRNEAEARYAPTPAGG